LTVVLLLTVHSDVTVTKQSTAPSQSLQSFPSNKMNSFALLCEAAARPSALFAIDHRSVQLQQVVSNSRQLAGFSRHSHTYKEPVRIVCGAMSRSTETAVLLEELLRPSHGGPAQMQRLLNFIGWAGPKEKDPSAVRIGVLGASQVRAAATGLGAEPAQRVLCSW
jgi:hypothetical protein